MLKERLEEKEEAASSERETQTETRALPQLGYYALLSTSLALLFFACRPCLRRLRRAIKFEEHEMKLMASRR